MVGAGQLPSFQDCQGRRGQPVSIVGGVRYWIVSPDAVPMVSAVGSG